MKIKVFWCGLRRHSALLAISIEHALAINNKLQQPSALHLKRWLLDRK